MESFAYELQNGGLRILSIAGLRAKGREHFRMKTGAGALRCPATGSFRESANALTAVYALSGGVEAGSLKAENLKAGSLEAESLEVEIEWKADPSGLLARTDKVTNRGGEPVALYAYSALTCMDGAYSYYTQASYWVSENQGRWETLTHGARELAVQGRPCRGVTPYMALKPVEGGDGMAVHLLADGDWHMRAEAGHETLEQPFAALSTGPASDALAYALAPGESLTVSRALFQPLRGGAPEAGAAALQKYLLGLHAEKPSKPIPIEYNTWFLDFQNLEEARLAEQLEAAAQLGCEAFTVDAGWYGQMTGGWFSQVGDWREKADGAFFGGMAAFADKVRAKGMRFGVWIEPERFARGAPAVLAHPDWFCPSAEDGSFLYPDLDNGEAAAHVFGMISEVIDRYGAGWVKIDFNQTLGPDPRGRAHIGYTARLRRIADDLRAKYPDVVFECCAGGGFRLEAESQRFFDVTFPSDNVNPCDLLRIGEGAALRALSGRILRWCCLRGARLPKYLAEGGAGATLAPRKALWDQAETVDAEFALKVCLLGQLSFSGDLASLDGETKAKIAKAVDFAKKHRRFVQNGVTHPLTPAAPIEDRSGWSAAFVSDADATEGILYAFRLDSPEAERAFALPLAEWDGSYELTDYDTGESRRATWRALREAGAAVSIPARMRGSVWTVRRAKAQA